MKVKHCMQGSGDKLVTVKRDALLSEAGMLMKQHGIRHLPVLEGDKMVGFITESDILRYTFSSRERDIYVHEVMVRNIITINVNATIEKAARLIHDYKIGGLPVLDKKNLVGIITVIDLLSALISVMGLLKVSTRIDVLIDKNSGLEDVARIIEENGGEIVSVATEQHSSRKKLYGFRLEKCEVDEVIEALEEAGHKVVAVLD